MHEVLDSAKTATELGFRVVEVLYAFNKERQRAKERHREAADSLSELEHRYDDVEWWFHWWTNGRGRGSECGWHHGVERPFALRTAFENRCAEAFRALEESSVRLVGFGDFVAVNPYVGLITGHPAYSSVFSAVSPPAGKLAIDFRDVPPLLAYIAAREPRYITLPSGPTETAELQAIFAPPSIWSDPNHPFRNRTSGTPPFLLDTFDPKPFEDFRPTLPAVVACLISIKEELEFDWRWTGTLLPLRLGTSIFQWRQKQAAAKGRPLTDVVPLLFEDSPPGESPDPKVQKAVLSAVKNELPKLLDNRTQGTWLKAIKAIAGMCWPFGNRSKDKSEPYHLTFLTNMLFRVDGDWERFWPECEPTLEELRAELRSTVAADMQTELDCLLRDDPQQPTSKGGRPRKAGVGEDEALIAKWRRAKEETGITQKEYELQNGLADGAIALAQDRVYKEQQRSRQTANPSETTDGRPMP